MIRAVFITLILSLLLVLTSFIYIAYEGIELKQKLKHMQEERDFFRKACIKQNGDIARANKMLAKENVMYIKQY